MHRAVIDSHTLAELAAPEKCAQNPAYPLTRSEDTSNPAARQQVLDTVASVRLQTKTNAAVLCTSLTKDTASGLVASAPWPGFIVSAAVDYPKETRATQIFEVRPTDACS